MKGKWKKNTKGNAVLQKYMVAVGKFVKRQGGTEDAGNEHGLRFVKKKSRKDLRKEKRKHKKAKMKSHYEGKKSCSLPLANDANSSGVKRVQQKKEIMEKVSIISKKDFASAATERPVQSKVPPSSKKGKHFNKLQESRKMALMEANEQEDREIKKMECCLGLNKRKNKKNLPQSFVADGLDYILGVLDSSSLAGAVDDDMDAARANFETLDESDTQTDENEELGDGMESVGSNEDMAPYGYDGDDDDDGMNEDEIVKEKMEDDKGEMNKRDGEESEEEEEADAPDLVKAEPKPDNVSWLC